VRHENGGWLKTSQVNHYDNVLAPHNVDIEGAEAE
jgi:hypothetical protein